MLNQKQKNLINRVAYESMPFSVVCRELKIKEKLVADWYEKSEEFRKSFEGAVKMRCEINKQLVLSGMACGLETLHELAIGASSVNMRVAAAKELVLAAVRLYADDLEPERETPLRKILEELRSTSQGL